MSRTRYTRLPVGPLPNALSGFHDNFNRSNGVLGNGWVDLATANPTDYNPLGIFNNQVVCTNHTSRPGTPLVEPAGAAYRQMPTAYATSARVSVEIVDNPPHEPAPLLHVVPGTAETGLGVWYSTVLAPLLLIGPISDPPEDFTVLASKLITALTDGDWLAAESDGTNISVYINGVIQTLDIAGGGTSTQVVIPANLVGSRNHGFAYDGHFDPASNEPVISQVLIQPAYS